MKPRRVLLWSFATAAALGLSAVQCQSQTPTDDNAARPDSGGDAPLSTADGSGATLDAAKDAVAETSDSGGSEDAGNGKDAEPIDASDAQAKDASGSDAAPFDGASTVVCTFTRESHPEATGCGTCALPPPYSITRSNVPLYLNSGCAVLTLQDIHATYGLVVDAPEVWANWYYDKHNFCLAVSASGDLVSTPYEDVPNGTFTGSITVSGGQADVTITGSHQPGLVNCGVIHGCVLEKISCTGKGPAVLTSCATNNGGCDKNATCTRTGPTTNTCACNEGYSGDGMSCVVINPCLTNNGGCSPNATCAINGPGHATCTCNAGYAGDGITCVPL